MNVLICAAVFLFWLFGLGSHWTSFFQHMYPGLFLLSALSPDLLRILHNVPCLVVQGFQKTDLILLSPCLLACLTQYAAKQVLLQSKYCCIRRILYKHQHTVQAWVAIRCLNQPRHVFTT